MGPKVDLTSFVFPQISLAIAGANGRAIKQNLEHRKCPRVFF